MRRCQAAPRPEELAQLRVFAEDLLNCKGCGAIKKYGSKVKYYANAKDMSSEAKALLESPYGGKFDFLFAQKEKGVVAFVTGGAGDDVWGIAFVPAGTDPKNTGLEMASISKIPGTSEWVRYSSFADEKTKPRQ